MTSSLSLFLLCVAAATLPFASAAVSVRLVTGDGPSSSLSKQQPKRRRRHRQLISNGSTALVDRHDYAVHLVSSKGRCAGSLIADNAVLTSASCAADYGFSVVRVGVHAVDEPAGDSVTLNIIYRVVHPDNDLAVLVLETKIEEIRPVCMADLSLNIPAGKELYILGWGETDDGQVSNVLQEAGVEYITNGECSETVTKYSENTYMCTALTEGKGTCLGDEGGPLIIKGGDEDEDVLVGVVTASGGCGYLTTIYSRLSVQRAWIDGVV
eukprot:CAMPEP_0194317408 /NCGR_PEP_ID=MMETSP0171-20130528/14153_1 /TAXON_ID=218684 /ORGANISM="Corethron pennatum, Strain L29A3" /LENGTH=267 /DNA_ID=CAMNT_0039073981 /DNA_START=111 /DNA_END=910 /DNA_ORIENTATION=+